jgi:hypothetical protein
VELLTKKVPIDFNLFLFGDAHRGSIFMHEKGWLQLVDHMRSKIDGLKPTSNYGIDHGDCIDAIDPKDKRYTATTEEGFILEQMEDAKKDRIAIKDQLLCILLGNHEIAKWTIGNITKKLCEDLKVPYGGWSTKITFKNRRGEYLFKHLATHGSRVFNSVADDPKRRRANKLLSLKRFLSGICADAVSMSCGHSHWCDRLKPETDVYFASDSTDIFPANTTADHTAEYIHPDLRWYVNTGSFYDQYKANSGLTSYAERRGFRPLRLGYQLAKIRGKTIESIEPVWLE